MSKATLQRDAIIEILNDPAYLGPRHADKTFQVIEQVPVSVVVGWRDFSARPRTHGNPAPIDMQFVFALTCFVRDEGDTGLTLDRVSDTIDLIILALYNNQTLNDTCQKVTEIHATRVPGQSRVINGATWLGYDVDVFTIDYLSE